MPTQKPPGGGAGRGGGGGQTLHKGDVVNGWKFLGYDSNGHAHWQWVGKGSTPGTSTSTGGGGSFGGGGGGGAAVTTVTGRKLSQAQVDALKADFNHISDLYGVNPNPGLLNHWVKMDLSSTELLQRFQALQRLREFAPFTNWWNQTLIAQGITKGPLNREQLRNFILGRGPAEWNNAYAEAMTRYGLGMAGITPTNKGGPEDLTVGRAFIKKLEGTIGRAAVESPTASVSQIYGKIAQDLFTVLPESRYEDFGISKQDIATAEAGGPQSIQLGLKVHQALANIAARTKPMAELGAAQSQQAPLVPTGTE